MFTNLEWYPEYDSLLTAWNNDKNYVEYFSCLKNIKLFLPQMWRNISSIGVDSYHIMWGDRATCWRRQMETFSALPAICAGWINNREAGDLRRHVTHYDATVMIRIEMIRYIIGIGKW